MILLNSNEIKSVHGAGAWDDFWESFGRSVADIMFDMSYSSHSREVHSMGASGRDAEVRAESPNDPLL